MHASRYDHPSLGVPQQSAGPAPSASRNRFTDGRPHVRRRLVALAAAAAALAGAAPAPAAVDARLDGAFSMRGVVTRAVHVRGEHHGLVVTRRWVFTPSCPSGPCGQVSLTRRRAGGTDTLTLTRTGPGVYTGSSRFFVPVLCQGARVARGGEVPYTISVRVTAAGASGRATRIAAAYNNPRRINHTRCPGSLGRDAARYTGRRAG